MKTLIALATGSIYTLILALEAGKDEKYATASFLLIVSGLSFLTLLIISSTPLI